MLTNKVKRYLVTGGDGFIGSALVRHLLDRTPHQVLNISKASYSVSPQTLKSYQHYPRYHYQKLDICEAIPLKKVIYGYQPDVIVHLAAESHVDNSIFSPDPFIQSNIIGTYTLIKIALDYWQTCKPDFRFHHVSTDEVYGSLSEEGAFTETTAYAPNSPYAASKAASDLLVRAWYKTYGFPMTMSHCSNNYGPYQFPEKLIPTMIIKALRGEKLPIYGDGQNIRDWLYVDDHIDALMQIIDKGHIGESYCISGQTEIRNIDLVLEICRILDTMAPSSSHESYRQLISYVPDRLGHDYRYASDIDKISTTLGWVARTPFKQGLISTVRWYLDNHGWWQGLQTQKPSLPQDNEVRL